MWRFLRGFLIGDFLLL
ncbi:hypothetical protein LINPERHAP1_LOCUS7527 [Linum perenne]